jgi:hypothetical protein
MVIEGQDSHDDIDSALLDLDSALEGALIEIYGE